jgi:hypothetical protein
MKNYLNIIMGIVMFIVTTALIGFVIYFTNPSLGSISLICAISGVGYIMSYLFLTNHLN